jgi:hypothetical protein
VNPVLRRAASLLLVSGAAVLATAGAASASTPAASPSPVFVAKDLAGGAYYTVSTAGVSGVTVGTDAGRDGLLTVNQAVILPVQKALGL